MWTKPFIISRKALSRNSFIHSFIHLQVRVQNMPWRHPSLLQGTMYTNTHSYIANPPTGLLVGGRKLVNPEETHKYTGKTWNYTQTPCRCEVAILSATSPPTCWSFCNQLHNVKWRKYISTLKIHQHIRNQSYWTKSCKEYGLTSIWLCPLDQSVKSWTKELSPSNRQAFSVTLLSIIKNTPFPHCVQRNHVVFSAP